MGEPVHIHAQSKVVPSSTMQRTAEESATPSSNHFEPTFEPPCGCNEVSSSNFEHPSGSCVGACGSEPARATISRHAVPRRARAAISHIPAAMGLARTAIGFCPPCGSERDAKSSFEEAGCKSLKVGKAFESRKVRKVGRAFQVK